MQNVLEALGGDIHTAQCDICKDDTLERCKAEHPDWFTKKRRDPKMRSQREITQYLHDNTPRRPCVVLTDMNDEFCETYDRCSVCGEHLQILAQHLNDIEPQDNND